MAREKVGVEEAAEKQVTARLQKKKIAAKTRGGRKTKKAPPGVKERAASRTGRKARRASRKALPRILAKGLPSESAPSVLFHREGGKVEPVWSQYSQMTPAKLSKRPGIPTDIRLRNLVGWKTEFGKDRIGVVQAFMADIAVVLIGGEMEYIRISRLTKLAEKARKE